MAFIRVLKLRNISEVKATFQSPQLSLKTTAVLHLMHREEQVFADLSSLVSSVWAPD